MKAQGLLVLAILVAGATVGAETRPAADALKGAFIYNFVRFTDWPSPAGARQAAALTVAVLGPDLQSIEAALVRASRQAGSAARPVIVKRVRTVADAGSWDVLFVPAAASAEWPRLRAQLGERPVLTVGDGGGFAAAGGMIGFYREGDRLRFEVNRNAVEGGRLRISSRLLSMARLVRRQPAGELTVRFRDVSFKHKLMLAIALAAGVPALLASASLLYYQRRHLVEQTLGEAWEVVHLLEATSGPALAFGDAQAARENLAVLGVRPQVLAAALYRTDGSLLAAYRGPAAGDGLPAWAPAGDGVRAESKTLILSHPVEIEGERLGRVVVQYDLSDVQEHLRHYAGVLALVMLASGACLMVIAAGLRRALTDPLHRLAGAAQAVSQDKDYSLRVPIRGRDELGTLTAAFNEMLGQIQERDVALQAARDELEQRVRDRVSDLQREVHERRQVEQALRESQGKLNDILEHSTNLFYAHDLDHQVTFVSPQTRTFLDCEPEEVVRWIDFMTDHPKNVLALQYTDRALETGQPQPTCELELRGRKGRTVWVEVNEAPVVRDGRTVAVVGALTDITMRKRAEEERAGLEAQIRQAQKMEAVGRLAGGIAHDFNNLLSVIQGYAELLLRNMEPASGERSRVDQILKASERAAVLTSQLLAFSRKQVLDPTVLSLATVVTDMEGMVRRLLREDITLQVRSAPRLPSIKADRGQIEQVLLNLVVNARDAMPGGGSIVIELADTLLRGGGPNVELAAGPYVTIRVSDTGHGMDAETMTHIFEPFFTTKEKGAGTGLGLATVYGILQQSGGGVDVASIPGKGTAFTLYIPACTDEPLPAVAEPAASRPAAGCETVLLVEDEDSLRHLIREILETQNYSVLDAPDGPAALRVSASHPRPIHLLLTDVIMPGMSGRELAAGIQRHRPTTRVLYMSGYTDDVIAQQGILDSDILLLPKPFTAEALSRRVREALERGGSARPGRGTPPRA